MEEGCPSRKCQLDVVVGDAATREQEDGTAAENEDTAAGEEDGTAACEDEMRG